MLVFLFFVFHCIFLKARYTCTPQHPWGAKSETRLCIRPPWLLQFFSPDILEVLLKLTGFLGFGEGRKETTEPWFSSPGYHVCFDVWVWRAFLAVTVQIQPWASAGHSTAMSRLLGQGVLLFCLQVIHTQLLGSGVTAPSCSALSLRS